MPTPGAQHAHARRTARTPQAHASSSTRTRAQHPTTTSTQAHNQRQACRRPRARKRTYTRTTRDKHALPGPRPPIARTSSTTRKADHARPPQNRRRLGTTWRRRRDHGPGHNIPQNHRPRPRPRTRTTPVAAHGRPRTRTPTHTDAFPPVCRGTANYSRPPSPARLLRSGCGRRSPARPCRASFHHSPSARALRAARTHAEPRRSITTIAQSPPVARLSLRPHQRRRTHVSACLPPGAGPQSPANERPASAPPVFGGRGGRPRPAPLTIGPRSPATPHGATCTHPPVPTPCTHTAPTCTTPRNCAAMTADSRAQLRASNRKARAPWCPAVSCPPNQNAIVPAVQSPRAVASGIGIAAFSATAPLPVPPLRAHRANRPGVAVHRLPWRFGSFSLRSPTTRGPRRMDITGIMRSSRCSQASASRARGTGHAVRKSCAPWCPRPQGSA